MKHVHTFEVANVTSFTINGKMNYKASVTKHDNIVCDAGYVMVVERQNDGRWSNTEYNHGVKYGKTCIGKKYQAMSEAFANACIAELAKPDAE